jgi:hypothetical protein
MDQQLLTRILYFVFEKIRRVPSLLRNFASLIEFQIAIDHQFDADLTEFYCIEPLYRRYAAERLQLSSVQIDDLIRDLSWDRHQPTYQFLDFQSWYYRQYVPRSFKNEVWNKYALALLLQFLEN